MWAPPGRWGRRAAAGGLVAALAARAEGALALGAEGGFGAFQVVTGEAAPAPGELAQVEGRPPGGRRRQAPGRGEQRENLGGSRTIPRPALEGVVHAVADQGARVGGTGGELGVDRAGGPVVEHVEGTGRGLRTGRQQGRGRGAVRAQAGRDPGRPTGRLVASGAAAPGLDLGGRAGRRHPAPARHLGVGGVAVAGAVRRPGGSGAAGEGPGEQGPGAQPSTVVSNRSMPPKPLVPVGTLPLPSLPPEATGSPDWFTMPSALVSAKAHR